MRFFDISKFLAVSFLFFSCSVLSDSQSFYVVNSEDVWNKVVPLSDGLFGDGIDTSTGQVSFQYTDIDLKGNFDLPVRLRRIRKPLLWGYYTGGSHESSLGDWSLDFPHITSSRAKNFKLVEHCGRRYSMQTTDAIEPMRLVVNGQPMLLRRLHSSNRNKYPTGTSYVTKEHWAAKCVRKDNGDYFLVVFSPDGSRYNFDTYGGEDGFTHILYASQVTDKNGNWVKYENLFAAEGKIHSSDGREIKIFRNKSNSEIERAEANGRIWIYQYKRASVQTNWAIYGDRGHLLERVIRPDNKSFHYQYNYNGLKLFPFAKFRNLPVTRPNLFNGEYFGKQIELTISHPEGAVGKFDFHVALICGIGVVKEPDTNGKLCMDLPKYRPHLVDFPFLDMAMTFAQLDKKEIQAYSGSEKLVWNFDYSDDCTPSTAGCVFDAKAYTYISHNNVKTKHTYEVPLLLNKLLTTEIIDITDPRNEKSLIKTSYDYDVVGIIDHACVSEVDITADEGMADSLYKTVCIEGDALSNNYLGGDVTSTLSYYTSHNKFRTRKVTQELAGSNYYMEHLEFDSFDRPSKTFFSNDFNSKIKYQKTEYIDFINSDVHLLSLPLRTSLSTSENTSYVTVNEFEYYPAVHDSYPYLLKQEELFGLVQKDYPEYHLDGSIKRVEFNQNLKTNSKKRYQKFNSYRRGIPQAVEHPKSMISSEKTFSRIVDGNGWVTQTNDFNGNIINYGYDQIGRLTYIDPVDSSVSDTLIIWSYNGGTSGKQPVRTEKRCALDTTKTFCSDIPLLTTTETYDGLLRPVLTETYDGVSRTFVRRIFNSHSKVTFESFPSTFADEKRGINYDYDGLNRLKEISVTGGGTTKHEYLSGNRIKVTDAGNNETTTTYLAYGGPMYEQATKIESPESVTTDINIDVFGNIQSIRQHATGVYPVEQTEYRAYDAQKRLCQISRSDVGTTVFNRNNLGEIKWMGEGQAAASTSVCNTNVSDAEKVTYTYDNLGQPRTISYGDNTPTRTYSYDNNGNVKNITNGIYTQSYNYNSLNLVEDESLTIDGYSFILDYEYTPLGHLGALTYPGDDLAKVDFATNGFGQATQAIRFRSGADDEVFVKGGSSKAKYHPNGIIESFTYGNGVTHNTALNSRSLPRQITDLKFGKTHVNLTYGYDNNLNITSITNPKDGGIHSLSLLQYDGLDRLISTTGGTGIGSSTIAYDGIGNIRSYKNTSLFDPSNLTYQYDNASNRLMSVSNGELSESSDDGQRSFGISGYDTRGNILKNGKRGFTYNRANQMIRSDTSLFEYDGHNRRIKYQKDNGKVEYSIYSHSGKMLYRKTEKGYINYIFLGDKLVAKEGTGLAEGSGGSGSDMNYKPFGDSVESPKDDVGYTGHKFDKELGLSYMQARYYDPVIGRFYSNDPVDSIGHMQRGNSIAHGFNRYTYANNNPYKYTDPDGEFIFQAVGFAIGAVSSYKAAKKAGLSGKSLFAATAIGGGVGALTGGFGGAVASTSIKAAFSKALGASTTKVVKTIAGNTVSGAIAGATGEVVGSIANDKLPTKAGLIDSASKGAFSGAVGGTAATVAGPVAGAIVAFGVDSVGKASATESNTKPIEITIKCGSECGIK